MIVSARVYEPGFDEQALIGFKFVPFLANDTVDSTNDVNGCRKKRSGGDIC